MADIRAYRPEANSLSTGQVLSRPYDFDGGRLIVREMADLLSLDLVDKGLVTDQIVLTVGYDIENLTDETRRKAYTGPTTTDFYGRTVPKHAHGTQNLGTLTASTKAILEAVTVLYERVVDKNLLVRRMYVVANHVVPEKSVVLPPVQYDLFSDPAAQEQRLREEADAREREKRMQTALVAIRKRYGKNAILKGMNFEEGATTRERNSQVGGHKA